MTDLSHLDKKYFIDPHVYNCPFCRRNNVRYNLHTTFYFHWSEEKLCYAYLVQCLSIGCAKFSIHLSYRDIRKKNTVDPNFFDNVFADHIDIDSALFFSQPTSYFVLDNRIPKKIRELVSEAENSRKANFLVGASASIRKAIYELLKEEAVIVKNEKTGRADYQESIKELKRKFSKIEPEHFDDLGNIQQMASDQVHEDSWEAWDSPKLRFIIELAKTILYEIYVVPAERRNRSGQLSQMKSELSGSKKQTADKSGKSD